MKYQNYLFLGIATFFWGGCNFHNGENSNNKQAAAVEDSASVESDKNEVASEVSNAEKNALPINPKIKALVEKTEALDVPLDYSFEDPFNQRTVNDVEPLSEEIQDLLQVEKFTNEGGNISGEIWLSCQLNLSPAFKTLIFSISDGGTGENILVNYTNDFKFIDYKNITFEDYIEGYFSSKSRIENNQIIRYNAQYTDYPKKDTLYFKISRQGRIDSVTVKAPLKK